MSSERKVLALLIPHGVPQEYQGEGSASPWGFFFPCTFSSGLRRPSLTASILSRSLLHQRQACLFFWHCWSSPSHNKLRTPSHFDKDRAIGRRHVSLRCRGSGVVIGEETIQSCQPATRAFPLTDEWCRILAEPRPARASLPTMDTAPPPPPAHPTGQGRFLRLKILAVGTCN